MIRITNLQSTRVFLGQMQRTRAEIARTQQELSTGIRISDPSDDPGRAGTINSLLSTGVRIQRHQERIALAQGTLEVQEEVVTNAENVMIRLKELAVQGANGSIDPSVRAQMAEEVFQLRDQLAALANTKYQGSYLYGGLADQDTPPFTANDTYFTEPSTGGAAQRHWELDTSRPGYDQTRSVNVSDTETVRLITSGADVFVNAINAATTLGRALSGFQTATDAADGDGDGDTTELANTQNPQLTFPGDEAIQLGEIHAAIDLLDQARSGNLETELSSIGARLARLDQVNRTLDSLKLTTEQTRSTLQDADPFESASEFSALQISLEALLTSGAQINSLSLLNFI